MKKKVLIILIIVLSVLLIAGGVFAFIFFGTDTFKSNKDMFLKYISKNTEIVDMFKDQDIKSYAEKQRTTPYSSTGTITTNIAALQKCNITFEGQTDLANNFYHRTVNVNYPELQTLSFELIKNDDVYAIKSDEIVNRFIGIQNVNLKEFATKMGASEEIVASTPDKIELSQLAVLSNVFTEEEKTQLKEKYFKIISDKLTDEMFSKEKANEESVYTLTINENQAQKIASEILMTLKDDELVISKIKNLAVNTFGIQEDIVNQYIETLKKEVQSEIDNSSTTSTTTENKVYIKVYVKNKELSKTEIIIPTTSSEGLVEPKYEFNIQSSTTESNDTQIDTVVDNTAADNTVVDNTIVDNTAADNTATDNTVVDNTVTENVETNNTQVVEPQTTTSTERRGVENKLTIIKTNDSARIEIYDGKETPSSISIQKLTSENQIKYDFSAANGSSQTYQLIISFNGISTDQVTENAELSVGGDLWTYNTTKIFNAEISKDGYDNSNVMLVNTAPNRESVEKLFSQIEERFIQINNAKMAAAGIENQDDLVDFVEMGAIPVVATKLIQMTDIMEKAPIIPVALATGAGIMTYNSADGVVQNETREIKNLETQVFNTQWETYIGTNKTDSDVRTMVSAVIANNATEKLQENGHIVKINGAEPKEDPTVDSSKTYTISLEYDENGFVNGIKYIEN